MARTRSQNQLDHNNVTSNNSPPNPVTKRVARAKSSNVQSTANQGQIGEVDIPKQLTEEQRRQLKANPVTIATMRRIIEEQHNDLTNLVSMCVTDTARPLIITDVHEIANKQGASTNSTQIQPNPVFPPPSFGYAPQSSNLTPNFSTIGQVTHLTPLRILRRGEGVIATQTCGPMLTNEVNWLNPLPRTKNGGATQTCGQVPISGNNIANPVQASFGANGNGGIVTQVPQQITPLHPCGNVQPYGVMSQPNFV